MNTKNSDLKVVPDQTGDNNIESSNKNLLKPTRYTILFSFFLNRLTKRRISNPSNKSKLQEQITNFK